MGGGDVSCSSYLPVKDVSMNAGERCPRPATHRIFWPGKEPNRMCEAHALHAKAIADAMGFHLVVETEEQPA